VQKDGRLFGLADGKVCVEGENADEVWQRLHDEAGKANPKYFGFDGARARSSLSPSRLDGTASGWRWFRARDAEAHVIHPSSVAVSREPSAKTDQLDTELSVGARDRGRHRDGRHAGAPGAVAARSIEAHVIHAATMGDALSPSCRQCTTVVDLASWLTDPAEIHAGR
jgi:hypothetical protein